MTVVAIHQATANKFEFASEKSGIAIFFILKVIIGKHGFYNGGIYENFKIPFLTRKIYHYWSAVYQKMQN